MTVSNIYKFYGVDDITSTAAQTMFGTTVVEGVTKQNFLNKQQKTQEIADLRNQQRKEKAFQNQLTKQQKKQRQDDLNRINRAYKEDTGTGPGSYGPGGTSGQQSDGSYNDPFDPGGGEKDGGFIDGSNRRPFAYGGLASIL